MIQAKITVIHNRGGEQISDPGEGKERSMSAVSDEIRKRFKEGDDIRDAGLTTPADVVRYDDIQYGEDPKWQVMDLYRPRFAEGAVLPVIFSIHGGAWVYGDKERYQYYCMSLAERGFAVLNFTYRLSPEFQFPAPLEDAALVVKWMVEHAAEYGLDTKNVFAVGDSAGGHLLGLFSEIKTNPDYAAEFNFTLPDFSLRAVALNCGSYTPGRNSEGETEDLMKDFLPEGGTDAEIDRINVLKHVTPDFPPAFVMTAVEDFLKEDALKIAQVFAVSDVPFVLRIYGDRDTRLGHVFHCNMKLAEGKKCNDDECDFFREYLG